MFPARPLLIEWLTSWKFFREELTVIALSGMALYDAKLD